MTEQQSNTVTEICTNPLHSDRQFTVNLSADGLDRLTFQAHPGEQRIQLWAHPRFARVGLSRVELDQLIERLTELRNGLPADNATPELEGLT